MTDLVCYTYTRGFLQYLQKKGEIPDRFFRTAIGGDLRPSTDRIMEAVGRGITDAGGTPLNCGKVPSPAVALHGLRQGIPAITVTGSHIPDDRNGIKFNKTSGEILKEDEAGITSEAVDVPDALCDGGGRFTRKDGGLSAADPAARMGYVGRYLDAFSDATLRGLRLGVYQHSAVGRDVMVEILQGLHAHVTPLGWSERFIPVDTEAIRPEDAALASNWAAQYRFDAIVSADGDSDRPLVSDEHGKWLRGDVAGILCAKFLKADSVTTPVSSNTALEKCGWFHEIRRTRIGSPYVVASMLEAMAAGRKRVVGYEANGGFLLGSDITLGQQRLQALPTRDAMIVILGVLLLARQEDKPISQLVAMLPQRFTASDRLQNFPAEKSREILKYLHGTDAATERTRLDTALGELVGAPVVATDHTDGLRATFANGEILHLRPSGNAPEFRCYAEASSAARAGELCAGALDLLKEGRVVRSA
jgi:phosphomannomutase